jgi:hypothetical protein
MLAAHPREEEQMKRVLAVLVALSLVMSMFTGVFAPVPKARGFASPLPVNLLSAGDFVILSESGIIDANLSTITGNIGAYPISGAAIHVTCAEVTGTIYSSDAAGPLPCRVTDPTKLNTAVNDMVNTVYPDARGRAPDATNLGTAGEIGGLDFAPGVYFWSSNVTISTDITLSGGPNDVWIFQIEGDLTVASKGNSSLGVKVKLNGAGACSVFWEVHASNFGATLGTWSTFNGNILSDKQIIMQSGAVLNGRALAQTLVTLDHNRVSPCTSAVAEGSVGGSVGGLVYPTNKQGIMRQLAALVALLAALCGLVVWSALVLSRRKRRNGTDTSDMQTGDKSGS